MPANVESMAYYGEKPWHGLGKEVKRGMRAGEMIGAAGLDWKVGMRPARGARLNKKKEASRYEIVRLPRPSRKEDKEILLGVVSKRYRPLQNDEAFSFFDPIVEDGQAYFETAGALGQGERIWVMAKMPGAIEVVRGDECWRYLLLSNTHTGDGAVTVKFTAVRVVCQNTLMLAMEDGQKAYRVRHSSIMKNRLDELAELIAAAQDVYLAAEWAFKLLIKTKLTEKLLEIYLEGVFPRTQVQRDNKTYPRKWIHIKELLENRDDLRMAGVNGTLWAAYNAVTRFEDYRQTRGGNGEEEGRLERVWFGSSAEVKWRAFEKARGLASAA
jgi:phage/plasmid-like protein (TIGR03299 family)